MNTHPNTQENMTANNELPRLLAEVERLRKENEGLRAENEGLRDYLDSFLKNSEPEAEAEPLVCWSGCKADHLTAGGWCPDCEAMRAPCPVCGVECWGGSCPNAACPARSQL